MSTLTSLSKLAVLGTLIISVPAFAATSSSVGSSSSAGHVSGGGEGGAHGGGGGGAAMSGGFGGHAATTGGVHAGGALGSHGAATGAHASTSHAASAGHVSHPVTHVAATGMKMSKIPQANFVKQRFEGTADYGPYAIPPCIRRSVNWTECDQPVKAGGKI